MTVLDEDEVRSLFSEYLERTLSPEVRDQVQVFLSNHASLAAELIQYERTLAILHRLPERESVIDMWPAISPEAEKYKSEFRLSLKDRIIHNWHSLIATFSEGVILYTRTVAARAQRHFSHHLLHASAERIKESGTDA